MISARHLARGTCAIAVAGFAFAASVVGPSSSPIVSMSPLPAARADSGLLPFTDCDQLRAWYVRQTLPHVTPWGLDLAGSAPIMLEDLATRSTATASAPEVGNGPTGTNVQEVGVDEPDIAKTYADDFVISVRRHALIVTDVTGSLPQVVSRVPLDDSFVWSELLVVGERVVVFGQSWENVFDGFRLMYRDVGLTTTTSLTTVDLSDPTTPTIVDRSAFTGDLSAARAHGATVRIVVTQATVDLPFVHPGPHLNRHAALQRNKALVAAADLSAWLPHNVDARGHETNALLGCDDIRHPEKGSGLGTITVLTVDPTSPGTIAKDAIIADGSLVYASADRLYVATVADGWLGWRDNADPTSTSSTVHAFAIDAGQTTYAASGEVDGVIPDRWAFSEHEGLLRVASTRGPSWNPSETRVTILREEPGHLIPIGAVDGLGKREQITAVRWFGDLAVVVTFRQTDPLYTVDLSNPTAPRVLGELKIRGFSRYLHPLGADLILGVGQSASRSGRTQGSQVSTFDLSSTSRIQKLDLEAAYSPVEDDARAFTYLPERNVAVIPLMDWRSDSSHLAVVAVGSDGSMAVQQRITVTGWGEQVRALPLPGDRIAVTSAGIVQQIVQID